MTIVDDNFTLAPDETIDAPAEGGGNAAPLPDNTRVLATILPTRKDGTAIEKRPYANSGPNSKITAQSVRFRIADGQRGAGRNVFGTVPLAYKFASGKDVLAFYGFYRALGYDVDPKSGFTLPADRELLGEPIELVLGIEEDNKGELRNTVKFFNKPRDISEYQNQTPATPARPAQSWTPGTTPAAVPAGAPAQAAPAAPGWLPPGAQDVAAIQAAAASGGSF